MTGHDRSLMIKKPADTPAAGLTSRKVGQNQFSDAVDMLPQSSRLSSIRTCGRLLRRHSPDVADWGWMWPDVRLSCTDSG
jgi:hypothetical protein